jgi:hypothetical protein
VLDTTGLSVAEAVERIAELASAASKLEQRGPE